MNFTKILLPFPDSISIIITYKCNANCDYCCFESNPLENNYLNLNEIKKIISHSLKLFTPKVVVFTGGEPTLYFETLIQSINYTNSLNIPSRIVSNCWWASSLKKAISIISKLANAGLTEINFSTGTQHQKFINFNNILFGIKAALKFNLKPVVVIEEDENANRLQMILQTEMKDVLHEFKIIRVQKVYLYSAKKKENFKNDNHLLRCKNIINQLTFSPENKVYPCCGLPIRKMNGFELCGIENYITLNRNELLNLLYNFQNSKLYIDGPFTTYCEQTDTKQLKFLHQCEQCYELYKNSNFFDEDFVPTLKDLSTVINKLALMSFIKKRVVIK